MLAPGDIRRRNWRVRGAASAALLSLVVSTCAASQAAATPARPAVAPAQVPAAAVASTADAAAPAGAGAFTPLSPRRVVDTRYGAGGVTGPVAAGGRFTVQLGGVAGVPAGAAAVALNLTVANSAAGGYVTIHPAGAADATSNVNVSGPGQTTANFVITALSASGQVEVFAPSGGEVIMDVTGYWTATSAATSGRYRPLPPTRLLDTRDGTGAPAGLRNGGQTVDVQITGRAGIPAGASAIVATITATEASGFGYVTAYASDTGRPLASNLNTTSVGATVPNLAVVPLSSDGRMTLYTEGAAHLIVDVAGWFTGSAEPSGSDGLFVPLSAPSRVADTRYSVPVARLTRGWNDEIPVAGLAGAASAVVANLTATGGFGPGYVTAYPARTPRPWASNVNYLRGQDVAVLSVAGLGPNDAIGVFSATGVDMVVDVSGWFTGTPAAANPLAQPIRRCDQTMLYLHLSQPGASSGTLRVRDLTGNNPDRDVVGNAAATRVAPGCEYLMVAIPLGNGRVDVYKVDDFATNPQLTLVIPSVFWLGMAISGDARYAFYFGALGYGGPNPDHYLGDVVFGYDVLEATRKFGFIAVPYMFYGYANQHLSWIAGVDPLRPGQVVIEWADFATNTPTGGSGCLTGQPYAVFGYCESPVDIRGSSSAVGRSSVGTVFASVGPDGTYVGWPFPGNDGPVQPQGYRVRFMLNGDVVSSASAGPKPGVWRYRPNGWGAAEYATPLQQLLDNVNDVSPEFASIWTGRSEPLQPLPAG